MYLGVNVLIVAIISMTGSCGAGAVRGLGRGRLRVDDRALDEDAQDRLGPRGATSQAAIWLAASPSLAHRVCCSLLTVNVHELIQYLVLYEYVLSMYSYSMSMAIICSLWYKECVNVRLLCGTQGHPTPRLAFVDVATGSLGQGLSCAAGMAYAGKYFDKARCCYCAPLFCAPALCTHNHNCSHSKQHLCRPLRPSNHGLTVRVRVTPRRLANFISSTPYQTLQ